MNTWYFILYFFAFVCFLVGTLLSFFTKPVKSLILGFICLGLTLATFVRVVQLFP